MKKARALTDGAEGGDRLTCGRAGKVGGRRCWLISWTALVALGETRLPLRQSRMTSHLWPGSSQSLQSVSQSVSRWNGQLPALRLVLFQCRAWTLLRDKTSNHTTHHTSLFFTPRALLSNKHCTHIIACKLPDPCRTSSSSSPTCHSPAHRTMI